jgi:site-specific recombinase XerD
VGEPKLMTHFVEMAEMLLQDYKVNARKASKAVTYPIRHLKNTFGLDRALDITTDRVTAHIAQRQDSGAKNATINRELAALKRMFSLAMQAGKLPRSLIFQP